MSDLPPLLRLRQQIMKPFGKALSADNSGTVAIEATSGIQLGSIDPLQKTAIDEITTLMVASQSISVQSATARRLKSRQDEIAAQQAAQAASKPAAAAPALTAEEKKNLTWDEARRLKQQQSAAATAAPAARAGRSTDPVTDKDGKPLRRTASGNVIDPLVVRVRNLPDVTAAELERIFGPENNLGMISRIFIAGGDKGMAYVTYKNEMDAAVAISKMNMKRFKYCLLHVDHGTVAKKRK